MRLRWVLLLVIAVCILPLLQAHKFPVMEYAYVGHIWEEEYTTIPLQKATGELIEFKLNIEHPEEVIEGTVTGVLSIYRDDTIFEWSEGKAYKRPDWLLIKEEPLIPDDDWNFTQSVTIDEPGSYMVMIDWYENKQYIGQSMHHLDVEAKTIGPLFIVFSFLIIIATLVGVKTGVL